jgi:predicted NBD/HSP70 family sugar kinase
MKTALAFDIGGTKIYYTIINENGEVIGDINKTSTPKTLDEIVNVLKTGISKYPDVDFLSFLSPAVLAAILVRRTQRLHRQFPRNLLV